MPQVDIDGTDISLEFPDDMPPDQIKMHVQDYLKKNQQNVVNKKVDNTDFGIKYPGSVESGIGEKPGVIDYLRHYLGQYIPGVLTGGGAAVGMGAGLEGGPGGAYVGAGLGAAAGSEVGSGLQGQFPRLFGKPPENPETQALVDGLVTGVGGEVVGRGVNASLPFLKEAGKSLFKGDVKTPIARTISSKLVQKLSPSAKSATGRAIGEEAEGKLAGMAGDSTKILDTAATNSIVNRGILQEGKNAAIHGNSEALKSALNKYNSATNTNVAKDLESLARGETTQTTYYNKIADTVFKDVQEVRNFKLATGSAREVNELAVNKIIRESTDGTGFNPDKILKALNGEKSDIYKEALDSGTAHNLDDLANALKEGKKLAGTEKSMLSWTGRGLVLSAATALTHKATAGTLILSEAAIHRFVSNPANVQLVRAAMKTPLNAPEAPFVQQALTKVLAGITFDLRDKEDGSVQKGRIDDNGQLVLGGPLR